MPLDMGQALMVGGVEGHIRHDLALRTSCYFVVFTSGQVAIAGREPPPGALARPGGRQEQLAPAAARRLRKEEDLHDAGGSSHRGVLRRMRLTAAGRGDVAAEDAERHLVLQRLGKLEIGLRGCRGQLRQWLAGTCRAPVHHLHAFEIELAIFGAGPFRTAPQSTESFEAHGLQASYDLYELLMT